MSVYWGFRERLFDIFRRWYDNKGIKILDPTVEITPDALLHFYVRDGTAGNYSISFATNNFKKSEVELLSKKFFDAIGIETHVYPSPDSRYPNKEYFILCITKLENIQKLFKFMKRSKHESVKRAMVFKHKFTTEHGYFGL